MAAPAADRKHQGAGMSHHEKKAAAKPAAKKPAASKATKAAPKKK
jgi:hypothetical protein